MGQYGCSDDLFSQTFPAFFDYRRRSQNTKNSFCGKLLETVLTLLNQMPVLTWPRSSRSRTGKSNVRQDTVWSTQISEKFDVYIFYNNYLDVWWTEISWSLPTSTSTSTYTSTSTSMTSRSMQGIPTAGQRYALMFYCAATVSSRH